MKDNILKFNELYDLDSNLNDAAPGALKLRFMNFRSILTQEIDEIKDIDPINSKRIDVLTELADLFGDLVVYCRSEAAKYNIPLEEVIDIIMESNFSKLDENGNPIKDERGKVKKGPNYWKPEPRIKELLLKHYGK